MPNWCSSAVTFYSENVNAVSDMHNRFVEIFNGQPTHENGFGHGWLGDYVNMFFPALGFENMRCRGSVSDIFDVKRVEDYAAFEIYVETAWEPLLDVFGKIIEEFFPDVQFAYIAEECGNGIYMRHDETDLFYPTKFGCEVYCPVLSDDYEKFEGKTLAEVMSQVSDYANGKQFRDTSGSLERLSGRICEHFESLCKDEDEKEECFCEIYAFDSFYPF